MKKLRIIISLSFILIFALSSLSTVLCDWTVFQGDNTHSGVSDSTPIFTPISLWSKTLSQAIYSTPIVSNNVVYVGANDKQLHAIDANTGNPIWNYATDGNIISTPCLSNIKVFFGSDDGYIYALNKVSGALVWKYHTDGKVESSPIFVSELNIIFIGSDDTNFYALNATNGNLLWIFDANAGIIRICPSYNNGVIYFGTYGEVGYDTNPSTFYAVNATTGNELWEYQTVIGDSKYIISSALIKDNIVYFGSQNQDNSTDGIFYALNAINGNVIWRYFGIPKYLNSCPVIYNNVIYSCSLDGYMYALNANNGNFLWRITMNSPIYCSPILVQNLIYIGSESGVLSGIDINGNIIWSYSTGSNIKSSFAVDNKRLYYVTSDPIVGLLIDSSLLVEISQVTPIPTSGSIMNFMSNFSGVVQLMVVGVIAVFLMIGAYVLIHKKQKRFR